MITDPKLLHLLSLLAQTVEGLEFDLMTECPGLPEQLYQSIAHEATHRTAGRCGGRDWAMAMCRLELIQQRAVQEMRRAVGEKIWDD